MQARVKFPKNRSEFPLPGQRIVVIGSSGSGKTTLAKNLAAKLGIMHVEMDALHWEPGWREKEWSVFRDEIAQALSGPAWVVDGNYAKARDIVWARADTLVWLDLPLGLVLKRLIRRTASRWISKEELWNGNRETLKGAIFSKDSLFLWMLKSRKKHRQEYPVLINSPEYAHLRIIHLTGAEQADAWFDSLSAD